MSSEQKPEFVYAEERWAKIVELLKSQSRISVAELSQIFDISEGTARRDLNELERRGVIRRTHGGAILRTRTSLDVPLRTREESHLQEKERIGRLAAYLISDGETIFIDAGTTTQRVARELKNKKELTVVTNGLNVCAELVDASGVEVILVGGTFRKESFSMVGPLAENTIRQFHADKAVLGIDAISLEKGLTVPNLLEASVKKEMIAASDELIVVADRSKVGRTSFCYVAPLMEIDRLVTDSGISEKHLASLREIGIEVQLAGK
ncbi:DeoR/GlpR family DNA-binding transcription regulator [Candidatus Hakubella thermalkaliphila]|nr:DeoR/GlpR family DNA-binding transcription regulator [Candidatus Hakubella thermalkaliphila]